MSGALGLQPWQWGMLALAYAIFFAAPAAWIARRARRDGDQVFVWTLLVLVGSLLGILEYFEHRAVLRRRARRAARAGASPPPRDYGGTAPDAEGARGPDGSGR